MNVPHLPGEAPSSDDNGELRSLFFVAFNAAGTGVPANLLPLKAKVIDFVRFAKSRGDPPERAIIALKRHTTETVVWHGGTEQQHAIREALILWCLDEYYGPAAAPTQAPPGPDRRD